MAQLQPGRTLARCLEPACPWRFTDGGGDRWCPDHTSEYDLARAALSLGIDPGDLGELAQSPPGAPDGAR